MSAPSTVSSSNRVRLASSSSSVLATVSGIASVLVDCSAGSSTSASFSFCVKDRCWRGVVDLSQWKWQHQQSQHRPQCYAPPAVRVGATAVAAFVNHGVPPTPKQSRRYAPSDETSLRVVRHSITPIFSSSKCSSRPLTL